MNSDEQREVENLRRGLEDEFDALPQRGRAKLVELLRREFAKASESLPASAESAFSKFTAGETGYGELQAQLGESLTRALFPRSNSGDV